MANNYTPVTNGRILIIPRGDFSATTQYNMLDVVNENGRSYMVKKTVPLGLAPSQDLTLEYYQPIGNSTGSIVISTTEPGQRDGDVWIQKYK